MYKDKETERYNRFIEDFKNTQSITKSRKKYKIAHNKALSLLKEANLRSKTRKESLL